ncbi:DUF3108 domain-containing protein [Rhodobacteraceae bacterium]|nr:DUF3108 domain-containing protein [Paracoccaceae bacterium]
MASFRKALRPIAAAVLTATIGLSSPAAHADQTDQIVFDVVLRGIKAGELRINGKIQGQGYGAKGVLMTTGIVGAVRKLRYDASVNGYTSGDSFTPTRYEETANTPDRNRKSTMVYQRGTPVSVSQTPPRKPRATDLDPARQGGTVDPLTALYSVLRNVDRAEACNRAVEMFDGSRRTKVTLGAPQSSGNQVVCAGEYRRIGGFSDREMAEKTRFPFTLTYSPAGNDRLEVTEISTDTVYGQGRLKRQ